MKSVELLDEKRLHGGTPNRYIAQWVSHRCAYVKLSIKGGASHQLRGGASLPDKASLKMGYRNDSLAISRDMGPLRQSVRKGK